MKGILFASLVLSSVLSGQAYYPYQYDFNHHYRNTYTPVETALGGMTSIFEPSSYGHNINPAVLINGTTRVDFTYRYNTHNPPGKEKYRTVSANYKTENYGAFGFSYVAYHPELFSVYYSQYNSVEMQTTRLTKDYYTFSYALQISPNFSAGLSLNYISDYVFYDKKIDYQSFDLALMYSREFKLLPEFDSRFILSFVLDNLYRMGEYKFTRSEYYSEEVALPQVFLLSASKQFDFRYKYAGKKVLKVNLQAGFTDTIDDKYFTLVTLGCELKIMEYFTLRYANSQAPKDSREISLYNFEVRNSFGFGLGIPLYDLIETDLPLVFNLDYGHSFRSHVTYENGIFGRGMSDQNAFSIGITLN